MLSSTLVPAEFLPLHFIFAISPAALTVCLTYAEGAQLSPDQMAAMKTELDPGATRNELLAEL